MNKVFLIGRLTKNPELRSTKSGTSVCEFTIAVNRDKDNADFIKCICWNKLAENLSKYQTQGSQISVLGELRVETYEINDKKQYKTYVLCNEIEYLSKIEKDDTNSYKDFGEHIETKFDTGQQIQIEDSDLPF